MTENTTADPLDDIFSLFQTSIERDNAQQQKGPMTEVTCPECGFIRRTDDPQDQCPDCRRLADNPHLGIGRFQWSGKAGNGLWIAQARWHNSRPEPEPGQEIVVRRQDGHTSVQQVHEVEGVTYDGEGRLFMQVFLKTGR